MDDDGGSDDRGDDDDDDIEWSYLVRPGSTRSYFSRNSSCKTIFSRI